MKDHCGPSFCAGSNSANTAPITAAQGSVFLSRLPSRVSFIFLLYFGPSFCTAATTLLRVKSNRKIKHTPCCMNGGDCALSSEQNCRVFVCQTLPPAEQLHMMPTPTPAWRPESRPLPKRSGTTSIDRAYWHSSWSYASQEYGPRGHLPAVVVKQIIARLTTFSIAEGMKITFTATIRCCWWCDFAVDSAPIKARDGADW
eukprot:scaffold1956_cov51-Cyclotella_meneghiniana.AAC.2